jgi:hypothetical protein
MRREYRLSHVRAVALHGRVPDRTGKLSLEVDQVGPHYPRRTSGGDEALINLAFSIRRS